MIPFGEYLPDLPPLENKGATTAKNVLPGGNSYKPFPSLSEQSDALDAYCQGAVSGRDVDGNSYNFAGDGTKLYQLSAGSWSDVSGSTYAVDDLENWEFEQFGSDIIAVNIADYPQKFTMGSDSAFSNLTTVLKARHIGVVRDNFVVVGNTNDTSDGAVPHRIRWCGINNHTSWTVSPVTLSDYQDLDAAKGWVRKIVGGAYGTIFQERAISRMTFVGSPLVFQIDQMENRGTQSPPSVIKFGDLVSYLGEDGFYIFDGVRSTPIGNNKIDKTFYSDFDATYPERVYGIHDPINQLLLWAYPGSDNTDGRPNRMLAFNYSPNSLYRWSYAEVETEILVRNLSEGYTMDSMDTYNSNLDAITISLDSRFWTGGNAILSGFSSSHKLASFTGEALDAVIETTEAELTPGRRANIGALRALIDGADTISVQVGTRNVLTESTTWGNAISAESNGDTPIRSNARYHRVRVNISGGFTYAQGIDFTRITGGGRR